MNSSLRAIRVAVVTVFFVALMSLPAMRVTFDVVNGYAAQWLISLGARYGEEVVVITPSFGEEIAKDDLARGLAKIDDATPRGIIVMLSGDRLMSPDILSIGEDLSAPLLKVISERHPITFDPPATAGTLANYPERNRAFGYFRSKSPSLQSAAGLPDFATQLFVKAPSAYWIHYLPRDSALATFDWDIATQGKLPSRFLADKLVVIATDTADYEEPLDLRSSPLPQPVPAATFVAQSLQALSDGRRLVATEWRQTILVAALVSFMVGFMLVRLRDRAHPLHYLAGVACILAVTVLLASTFQVMFPLSEALFAFTAAWWTHRFILDTNRRRRLRRQLIRMELITAGKDGSDTLTIEHWRSLVAATADTLGLSRQNFLVRPAFGKLVELSGDSDTIKKLSPAQRRALRQGIRASGEGTALLPLPSSDTAPSEGLEKESWLITAPTPTGARAGWLVTCDQDVLSASSPRRAMLVAATERLLHLYPFSQKQDVSQTLDERIAERARHLSKEAATLDALIHSTASAFAVFDLVGLFLRQNNQMREISSQSGINVGKSSLTGCIRTITGLSERVVNTLLFEMLADGEPRRLPAAGLDLRQKFVLRVSVDTGQKSLSEGQALGPTVLTELIDVTESQRLDEARRSVAQFFDQQLRNDFEAINLVSEMLDDPDVDDGMRTGLLQRLKSVTLRTTERMATFDVALGEMTGKLATQTVPQELRRALDDVCDMMIANGRKKKLNVEFDRPMLLSLVLAGVSGLPETLRALGWLCIADAPYSGTVRLQADETPDAIIVTIRSEGHGLPAEVVRQILDGSGRRLPDELRDVADAVETVREWGGSIGLESGLDRGLTCTLTLERVV